MIKTVKKQTIAVVGASGFIGKELIAQLVEKGFAVVAISRSRAVWSHKVEFRQADLYSMLQVENALSGVDTAVYLVHSMKKSSRLSQGSFSDFDLILADNFARASEKNRIKNVIYLSGLMPTGEKNFSLHLQSRFEVEKVFSSYSFRSSVLRAGLIIGPQGSTFQILYYLCKRLPIIVLPTWTKNKTQVVSIQDAVLAVVFLIDHQDINIHTDYDMANPITLTYEKLIRDVVKSLGVKRKWLKIPIKNTTFFGFFACILTQSPFSLGIPIIRSLKHDLLARKDRNIFNRMNHHPIPVYKSIHFAIEQIRLMPSRRAHAFGKSVSSKTRSVRSVQRMHLPLNKSIEEIASIYLDFLEKVTFGFIDVKVDKAVAKFYVRFTNILLLRIEYSASRSTVDRQLFYITGGNLDASGGLGRLEFRKVPGVNVLIAAIHEFQPRLPWFVYRYTQAIIHLFVMKSFSRYLQKIE